MLVDTSWGVVGVSLVRERQVSVVVEIGVAGTKKLSSSHHVGVSLVGDWCFGRSKKKMFVQKRCLEIVVLSIVVGWRFACLGKELRNL